MTKPPHRRNRPAAPPAHGHGGANSPLHPRDRQRRNEQERQPGQQSRREDVRQPAAGPPRSSTDSPVARSRALPSRLEVIETTGASDYALLDSGAGRKLERFGGIIVDRPEPQALWQPRRPRAEWDTAHAIFSASGEDDEKGRWRIDKPVPDGWPVRVAGRSGERTCEVAMQCRLQGLWHLGLFPEQDPHWQWMLARIAHLHAMGGEPPRVLNLFGYTGAASLLAASAGAHVTHVDASRKAVAWGRDNQAASRLGDRPIRWIVDDARKFTSREVRRGRLYDIVLVDPPKFGRGPEGETWDLFNDLAPLLCDCASLLDARSPALVLTVYAIRASALAFGQLVAETLRARGGACETGELAISEQGGGGRLVPTSLFVRWTDAPSGGGGRA